MDKGYLIIGGITVIVIGIMIGVVLTDPSAKPQVGDVFADQGREHITVGAEHVAYNSNPPTSGPHYAEPAAWGVYDAALPDEQVVHNLEHGGIWMSYHPEKVDQDTQTKLKNLAERYRSKIILTPRMQNDTAIALSSWTRLRKLESFDEVAIVEFISRNKNKGPEKVPDMGI